MKLDKIIKAIDGTNLTPSIDAQNVEISGGYSSDLLSDVMGNALEDQIWVTIIRHLNVLAVASLAGITAIVFPKNIKPADAIIEKAIEKNICLISSESQTFEISGKIYQLLND